MKKNLLRFNWIPKLTAFVLILELSIGTSILPMAAATAAATQGPDEPLSIGDLRIASQLQGQLEAAREGRPLDPAQIPDGVDRTHITKQSHRKYRLEGGSDFNGSKLRLVVDEEISLGKIDIQNQPISLPNAKKDLKIVYDPSKKELRFDHYIHISAKDGNVRNVPILSDSHVIHEVEIVGLAPDGTIPQDANNIYVATPEGVYAIRWGDVARKSFVAPISMFPIAPGPGIDGLKITGVELLNRASKPRGLINPETQEEIDKAEDGGLILTLEAATGSQTHALIPRREVILRLKDELLLETAETLITNPDVSSIDTLIPVLAKNSANLLALAEERETTLESSEDQGLLTHALTSLSQRTDWKKLKPLIELKDGATAFDRLASAPVDRFSVNPAEDGDWQKDYQRIQEMKKQNPSLSWREAYALSIRGPKAEPEKTRTQKLIAGAKSLIGLSKANKTWDEKILSHAPGAAEGPDAQQLADQVAKENGIINRMLDLAGKVYDQVVTPGHVKVLACGLTACALNYATGGAALKLVASSMSHAIHWSATIPGLQLLTSEIDKALPYLSKPYAIRRAMTGLAVVATFYPLAKIGAKWIANRAGRNWDAVTAFFTYGMQKIYAAFNNPLQRILVWNLLKQKNLYPAIRAGAVPQNVPLVLPWASAEALKKNAEEINNTLTDVAARKARAMLIAAAVIAKRDREDIASLLMAGHGKKLTSFIEMVRDGRESTRWAETFDLAYRGLKDIGDHPLDQEIDTETLAQYLDLFEGISKKIQALERSPTLGQRFLSAIRRLRAVSSKGLSETILPYVFFGSQGFEVYETFKHAVLDPESARIAAAKTGPDYYASASLYSLQSPDAFGELTGMKPPGAPRILMDQLQQVLLGAIIGVDSLTTLVNGKLHNPNRPLTDELFEGDIQRQQTFLEAIKAILKQRFDPKTDSYFETYAKYLENSITGFQVRLIVGGVCRMLGFSLRHSLDHNFARVVEAPGAGFGKETIMLLSKQTFQVGVDGKVNPGYTVPASLVNRLNRDMSNETDSAREEILAGIALVESGLRLGEVPRYQQGISILLAQFSRGDTALPDPFKIPSQEYSEALARDLLKFTLANTPAPTQINSAMGDGWGYFYSLYSSAVFAAVNTGLYNPDISVWAQLPRAFAGFVGTYAIVKTLPLLTRPLSAGVSRTAAWCGRLLRRTPQGLRP